MVLEHDGTYRIQVLCDGLPGQSGRFHHLMASQFFLTDVMQEILERQLGRCDVTVLVLDRESSDYGPECPKVQAD